MRITDELRQKVCSSYQALEDVEKKPIYAEIEKEKQTEKKKLFALIKKAEKSEFKPILEYAKKKRYYGSGDCTEEEVASDMVQAMKSDRIGELEAELSKIGLKYTKAKETFMIQLSYSKNIDDIKSVFAENGIEF